MRFDYANDPRLDFGPTVGNVAKFFPVIKPTASDDVVDRRKCPLGMIQMTVQHTS